MKKQFIIIMLILLCTSKLFSEDFSDRDLFGLGFTYTIPNDTLTGSFGLNILYTPADFITGFAAIAQSDFKTSTKIGLGLERYIILIPSSFINLRFFHLSIGGLGTYTFEQQLDYTGFGYDIYVTTGIALPPMQGIGITVLYNHNDSFSLRLEYSGGIFLEKIE